MNNEKRAEPEVLPAAGQKTGLMQLDLQCTLLADGHAEHAGNSQSSNSKDNGGGYRRWP